MKKIYIDPGHGGYDPGASGFNLQEKDIALNISKRIRRILVNNYENVEVKLSRTRDNLAGGNHLSTGQSLSWRADDANRWGADVFISVHLNAGGGNGFETYRYESLKGSLLQTYIHNNTFNRIDKAHPWLEDRGKKKANFAVLRETAMHAVLTENLFIDHEDSSKLLKNNRFLERLARGHAAGIAKFLNLEKSDDGEETTVKRFGWFRKFHVWKLPTQNEDEKMPIWQICQQGANYAYFGFDNTQDLKEEVADLKDMVQQLLDRENNS